MLNTRAFIGGRVTNALNNVCEEVGVRAGIIREDVFESIRSIAEDNDDMHEYDAIRLIYNELKDVPNIKSLQNRPRHNVRDQLLLVDSSVEL